MAEKKITRKVISKAAPKEKAAEVSEAAEATKAEEAVKSKRACFFCQGKTCPSYTDVVTLRKYLTDRAKIVARLKSNVCSKHQRQISRQIKYARHLALLPFIPKV